MMLPGSTAFFQRDHEFQFPLYAEQEKITLHPISPHYSYWNSNALSLKGPRIPRFKSPNVIVHTYLGRLQTNSRKHKGWSNSLFQSCVACHPTWSPEVSSLQGWYSPPILLSSPSWRHTLYRSHFWKSVSICSYLVYYNWSRDNLEQTLAGSYDNNLPRGAPYGRHLLCQEDALAVGDWVRTQLSCQSFCRTLLGLGTVNLRNSYFSCCPQCLPSQATLVPSFLHFVWEIIGKYMVYFGRKPELQSPVDVVHLAIRPSSLPGSFF